VLVIPAHLPHSAEALEYTLDVDVYSPLRKGWLNKTDDYPRDGARRAICRSAADPAAPLA
jgi:hypothetical protein